MQKNNMLVVKRKISAYLFLFLFIFSLFPITINPTVADELDPPLPEVTLVDRGATWNEYLVNDIRVREFSGRQMNYYDGQQYQPINTSFEILDSNHFAYQYGYRAGVEQAPFNTYFKPNAQDDYPVAFAYDKGDNLTQVLRSKLLAVGYYDPSSNHNYKILQNVQNSAGSIVSNTGTYENVFTGTDAKWTVVPEGIKEELILSNDTKTVLQNNPPSDFGFSNQYSYLVIVTKLDYQNLLAYNSSQQMNGNFTSSKINFRDISGKIKSVFPIGYAYEDNGTAHDLTYRLIQHNGDCYLLAGIKVTELNAMSFPVTIDPTLHVDTSTSDAYIAQYDPPTYDAGWAATSGTVTDSAYFLVGQSQHAGYQIYRAAAFFDTSSLPDDCVIDSACIALQLKGTDYSNDDFYIVAQKDAADVCPHDPMIATDYNKNNYSGDLGSVSSSKVGAVGSWINLTMNATGLANISKTGITKLILRSNQDIIASEPTDREYVEFAGDGWPSLFVNYSDPLPSVTTNASTNDNSTYAILNGYLSEDGGYTVTCGFRWDYDGSTGGWDYNATVGTVVEGATYLLNNTNFSAGTLYKYQAWADNGYRFANGSELAVLTRPNATTGFGSSVTATGIQSLWTHGDGYNTSVLVVNSSGVTDYPHNPTDGTVIYNGSSNSYHHTPLNEGDTYYYSLWEYTTWTYNPTVHKFSHLNQTASKKFETFDITLNATRGITSTNATFWGYIPSAGGDFSGNFNYGFWVGQTSPVTESNADFNFTNATTVTPAQNFSYNGSIATATHYYVKGWIDNGSYFNTTYNEDEFYSHPVAPITFTLTRVGDNIEIAWTKAGDYNTTILRKNGSYAATPQDATATVVYNGSASFYSDAAQKGHSMYYRAWGWYGNHSTSNHSNNWIDDYINITPDPPSNVVGNILSNNTLNITWTNGTGAKKTVIRRDGSAYPSTPQSGTETYNGTGEYNFEGSIAQHYYYTLWSFSDELFSSGVDLTYGALVINCYDEENNSLSFDVFVSNQSGTETYESNNASNPHLIDINNCPTGLQTSIQISAIIQSYDNLTENLSGYLAAQNETTTYIQLEHTPKNKSSTNVTCTKGSNRYYPSFLLSANIIYIYPDACPSFDSINISYVHEKYRDRYYYLDLYRNNVYILNVYLPLSGDAHLYYATVKDEYGEPLKDAKVIIKKYIYDDYKNISVSYTDSDGQVSLFLIPNVEYVVIVNKSNFDELEARWTPDPDYYGIYYPKYFTIQSTSPEIPTETFSDICVFTGEWVVANETLYISFYDKNNETQNTVFRIYESYNESLTFMESHSYSAVREITFYNSSALNISRIYEIRLEINHTSLGYITNQPIYVMPLHPESEKIKVDWISRLITSASGNFDFNYVYFGLIFVPCLLFIVMGGVVNHPGLGIVIAGGYLVLFTWKVSVSIGTILTTLITLFLLIGFIVIVGKKGRALIK